jgi:hypothetical protein
MTTAKKGKSKAWSIEYRSPRSLPMPGYDYQIATRPAPKSVKSPSAEATVKDRKLKSLQNLSV